MSQTLTLLQEVLITQSVRTEDVKINAVQQLRDIKLMGQNFTHLKIFDNLVLSKTHTSGIPIDRGLGHIVSGFLFLLKRCIKMDAKRYRLPRCRSGASRFFHSRFRFLL